MTIEPLGDSAFVLTLGDRIDSALCDRARAIARAIADAALPWVTELVPAYASVTVLIDPVALPAGVASKQGLRQLEEIAAACVANQPAATASLREIEIPVCYGGEFGPDIDEVAAHVGLSVDEVIHRHASASYTVGCIGFAPGFPYLIGLPPSLAVPRRPTPRAEVAAGSVAIGGAQTGIYPQRSPGGWHVIGRTPLRLFDLEATPPVLLEAGDHVRFVRISAEEFGRHIS